MVHDAYKYMGLAAFIILAIGLAFIIYKWPSDEKKSFSQLVAARRSSILYYVMLFSIVLPLLLLFFFGYFAPYTLAPPIFLVLVSFACILQYLATLFPEKGRTVKVHRILAAISAFCLPVSLITLLFTSNIDSLKAFYIAVGGVVMLVVAIVMIRKAKTTIPVTYPCQSVYYAGFLIPVLLISYI